MCEGARVPFFMRRAALTTIVPALFFVSCTGFPPGWSGAKRIAPADGVSGAWIGTWHSETNGHSGGLRCVAQRHGTESWQFRYRASWAKILCAGFTMEGTVNPDGAGGYLVTGSKDLGKTFGGVFTTSGTIREGTFKARYRAKLDNGTMEMVRLNSATRSPDK